MKKTTALLLCAVILVSLASCASSPSESSAGVPPEMPAAIAETPVANDGSRILIAYFMLVDVHAKF